MQLKIAATLLPGAAPTRRNYKDMLKYIYLPLCYSTAAAQLLRLREEKL